MSKIMRAINHTMRVGQMVKAGDTQEFLQHVHKNTHRTDYVKGELVNLNSTEHDRYNINHTLLMEREDNFARAKLGSAEYLDKSIAESNIRDDLINAGIKAHKLSELEMHDLKALKRYDEMFGGNEVSFAERLKNAAPSINADLEKGGFENDAFHAEIRPSIVQSIAFGDGTAPEKKQPVSLKEVNKKLMQNEKVREAFSELGREQMRFDESMTFLGKLKGVVNNIKDKIVDKFSDRYADIENDQPAQAPISPPSGDKPSHQERDNDLSDALDEPSKSNMAYDEQEKSITDFLDKDTDFNNSISNFLAEHNNEKEKEKELKRDEPEAKYESPSM